MGTPETADTADVDSDIDDALRYQLNVKGRGQLLLKVPNMEFDLECQVFDVSVSVDQTLCRNKKLRVLIIGCK